MTLLENVQGDIRANCLHFLDVTVASGQRFHITANGIQESAVELVMLPTVSKDRRSIQTTLTVVVNPIGDFEVCPPRKQNSKTSEPTEEVSQSGNGIIVSEPITLPDGQTIVFDGGSWSIPISETSKTPFLSDLPWLGQKFTTTEWRSKDQHVLILITPSILRR